MIEKKQLNVISAQIFFPEDSPISLAKVVKMPKKCIGSKTFFVCQLMPINRWIFNYFIELKKYDAKKIKIAK